MVKRLGFWDNEYAERRAVNETIDAVGGLNAQAGLHAQQLERLTLRHAALQKEVVQLRTVVRVLAELLIERDVLEHGALSERISAALAALEPPPPKPAAPVARMPREHGGASYRDSGVARVSPPPPPREVQCSRCAARVLAAETTVTEDGTLCAECYRAVQLAQLGGDD